MRGGLAVDEDVKTALHQLDNDYHKSLVHILEDLWKSGYQAGFNAAADIKIRTSLEDGVS